MREVIATGKTVEEATEAGCLELGLSRADVSVEILEMPVKKLFKTIPAKVRVTAEEPEPVAKPAPAPVAPPPKEAAPAAEAPKPAAEPAPTPAAPKMPQRGQPILPSEPETVLDLATHPREKMAADYLASIFTALGTGDAEITVIRQGEATLLRVEGGQVADKIDIRGETIQALSYLIDRAVNTGVDKKNAGYLRIRLDVAGYRSRRESELIELATRTGKEVARTARSRTLAPMNPYERLIVHTTISAMEGITSESIGADTERRVVVKSLADNATDGGDWRPPRKDGGRGGRGGGNRNDRGGRGGSGGGGRGGNSRGGDRGRGGRSGGGGGRDRQSSTPEREYADKPRDPNAAPVVPQRREAIRDGEDLPLYGKIEL